MTHLGRLPSPQDEAFEFLENTLEEVENPDEKRVCTFSQPKDSTLIWLKLSTAHSYFETQHSAVRMQIQK